MNEEELLFIAELDAKRCYARVHENGIFHAWACTGACKAQKWMKVQAELKCKWFGRVIGAALACA